MMTRSAAIAGSTLFFLIAPVTVAGIGPWWITRWHFEPPFLGIAPPRVLGIGLIAARLPVLIASFVRFALDGLGTPAPITPSLRLVIGGVYRYVHNPIYVALLGIVFGQAMLLGSFALVWYGAAFWLACHLFVVVYEEANLGRRFGAEYREYRVAVPRRLPRLTPWSPASDHHE
jgi:protein-S-isoprenylcysteine O-methyltransferase Ste14